MKRVLRSALRTLSRRRKLATVVAVPSVLLAVNVPPAITAVEDFQHDRMVNSAEYQATHGRWDTLELPADLKVNAIHAALLPTGKLLVIAGSGNDQAKFDAGTFTSLVYDPATGQGRIVLTPDDMFCAGHAFLQDGKLLVAGGTQRYEILEPQVTRATGQIVVKNENPDVGRDFPKGTVFTAPDGRTYTATNAFSLKPAVKTVIDRYKNVRVTASETAVWVESTLDGTLGVSETPAQYAIEGLAGPDAANLYGLGQKMTMDKQDFQGIEQAYEFDPFREEYVRVGDMHHKRWYPTLTGLPDGTVLAMSGLDGSGVVLPGQNEVYDPETKTWTERPDLFRYFPTYPAIFQTATEGTLFYSGSNAGYGPADAGRVPGFWNLEDNSFVPVAGLREPELMETSGSAWAGPVQDQKMIVVGGGGVGESPVASRRIDVIDLTKGAQAAYTPGPDLPVPTRYPNVVQLPDDSLLIANGSTDYRGKGGSDNLVASLYHPDSNTLSPAADPRVGRDYHSEGILLPTGQVMTLGGNALFKDVANTKTAPFEQRLEIYTPPYLFHGDRPTVTTAPDTAALGSVLTVASPQAAGITTARLMRPGAATHATDVEQRSVALDVAHNPDGTLGLTVPAEPTLVPPGYYMLFLLDAAGTPSVAHWVRVT